MKQKIKNEKNTRKKPQKTKTFTVKIDGDLHKGLETWLQSEEIKQMGYHSKSDFVNQAIRELIKRERGPRFTDLFETDTGDYTLIDTYLVTSENNILVILDKTHKTILCTSCKLDSCDHVKYIWKSVSSANRLARLGFVCELLGKRYDHHI